MSDDKRRLLFILIFAMIFASVIFGAVVRDDSANAGSEPPRVHKITRVLRTSDDYFAGMSDEAITKAGRVLCQTLKEGHGIETFLAIERDLPAKPAGDLIQTAIALNCPEFKNALQEFIDGNS
ncbi:MAG: hypothetical protein WAV00_21650 [Nocardioides sp.]